eukprot:TRINITY_DN28994_c0_g2_i1.p1 TRINITY_DN28994_c0_g2~~TRINITY_DN28994_c0_g2_i1.p1  ORF type:complete len:812 (-),score=132.40 TRINITY_DN28994_c0_g2_i1:167-2602(-)
MQLSSHPVNGHDSADVGADVPPPSAGNAAMAARAAAAAKAVAQAKAGAPRVAPPLPTFSASAASAAPVGIAPRPPVQAAPPQQVTKAASPEVFTLSAEDDDNLPDEAFNTVPLLDVTGEEGTEAQGEVASPGADAHEDEASADASNDDLVRRERPGLHEEELAHYNHIEQSMSNFHQRNTDGILNAEDLLRRLRTRIVVPSSRGTSEAGDYTSMASSEYDADSMIGTEDGLSAFGSRLSSCATSNVSSAQNSPRELGPLDRITVSSSAWPTQASDWESKAAIFSGRAATSSTETPRTGSNIFPESGLTITTSSTAAATDALAMSAPLTPQLEAPPAGLSLNEYGLIEAPPSPSKSEHIERPDFQNMSQEELDALWLGWTVNACPGGNFFFWHEERKESKWSQPPELNHVLGEWVQLAEEGTGRIYYRNHLLQMSLWNDPRRCFNAFHAVNDGNTFAINLYLDSEGPVNCLDSKNRSLLSYAASVRHTGTVELLLSRNANPNLVDDFGDTALMYACRNGCPSFVHALCMHKADVNLVSRSGNTALCESASLGQMESLHILLMFGGDPDLPRADGTTAMDLALRHGHRACATIIKQFSVAKQNGRGAQNDFVPAGVQSSGHFSYHPPARENGGASFPAGQQEQVGSAYETGMHHDGEAGMQGAVPYTNGSSHAVSASSAYASAGGAYASAGGAYGSAGGSYSSTSGPYDSSYGQAYQYAAHAQNVAGSSAPRRRFKYEDGSSSDSESDERVQSKKYSQQQPQEKAASRGRGFFGNLKQWLSGPVLADLGAENKFRYNYERRCWELPEDFDDHR